MARLLYWLVNVAALALLALVLAAPLLGGESRLVELFAEDATVRQTALASGVGMLVTARVFFRPAPGQKKQKTIPKRDVVGA
jgi:hypothetical protein